MNDLSKEWLCWFVGFVDGEGYFQILPQKQSHAVAIGLYIVLREDDAEIIDEIQQTLGIGNTYHLSRETDRKHHNRKTNDQVRWDCRNIHEVVSVLLPIFDAFPLRTKKFNDYQIWREAALLVYDGRHLSGAGRHRIIELWQQLKAQRNCNAPKRDYIPKFIEQRQPPLFDLGSRTGRENSYLLRVDVA